MNSRKSEKPSAARTSVPHARLKERLGQKQPGSLPLANQFTETELVAGVAGWGIEIHRDSFAEWSMGLGSAEEVVSRLMEQGMLEGNLNDEELEWIWAVITVLWVKWQPDFDPFELIDDGISTGYDLVDVEERCRHWLEVWPALLQLADKLQVERLEELDKRFRGTDYLENWVQDLEMEMGDVARPNQDQDWYRRRIDYCEKFLERFPNEYTELIRNMRRAWAESLFGVGETDRADQQFGEWLQADPEWSWGWLTWAECYLFGAGESQNLNRAAELLWQGLNVEGIGDQDAFYERLEDVYERLGQKSKAAEMRRIINKLTAPTSFKSAAPVRAPVKHTVPKVGRNDPCPCGSGKKFKKCCGG